MHAQNGPPDPTIWELSKATVKAFVPEGGFALETADVVLIHRRDPNRTMLNRTVGNHLKLKAL